MLDIAVNKIFYNGEYLSAEKANTSVFAQGLHYGNAVFDGLRSYYHNGSVHLFKPHEHFKRFLEGAETLGINMPYTPDELIAISYEILELNRLKNAYIRPLAFSGNEMRPIPNRNSNFMIAAWEWDHIYGNKPLNVTISPYKRINPEATLNGSKISGNYASSIIATKRAMDKGFQEALLLDESDCVVGGASNNIFIEKDEVLYTPPKRKVFPGITRDTVIDICRMLDILVIEMELSQEEVKKADSAFITGTAAEITGINSVDGAPLKLDWESSIGFEIASIYRRMAINCNSEDFELV